ncbi:unnamed protein product [Euphydryas editha]|uniref:Uncharacterized protein n=1 Tax=Euphydryas editha TaxID=104508 RepID=A0AAU9V145_EUPED|nr:unnamed protein product [Euphydryas editha]
MDCQRGKKLVEMVMRRNSNVEGKQNELQPIRIMAEEEPMPSTSSGHTGGMVIHREMDFSSDDSVLDPHFELPKKAADSSTSSDISTHSDTNLRAATPHVPESSPKKVFAL